jgi:hypothetical protein
VNCIFPDERLHQFSRIPVWKRKGAERARVSWVDVIEDFSAADLADTALPAFAQILQPGGLAVETDAI